MLVVREEVDVEERGWVRLGVLQQHRERIDDLSAPRMTHIHIRGPMEHIANIIVSLVGELPVSTPVDLGAWPNNTLECFGRR